MTKKRKTLVGITIKFSMIHSVDMAATYYNSKLVNGIVSETVAKTAKTAK